MRTVIYSRVSTDHQSHESQLLELREFCRRRGWDRVTEYADTISGASCSREGLNRLMAGVRRGRVDVVVCYKLDRLGRSLAHLVQVIGELTANGVALVVPGQGIDTSASNPASQLQVNILAAVAQFEREIIRERVNAGLRAAKARGIRLGRPDKSADRKQAVAGLLSEGKGVRGIARQLGLPLSSVQRIVRKIREDS